MVVVVDERLQISPFLRKMPPVLKPFFRRDHEEWSFDLVLTLELVKEY